MRRPVVSRPQAIAAVAGAVIVVGALSAWGISSSHHHTAPVAAVQVLGLGASPTEHATAACHDMASVQQLIMRDASKDQVFAYLDAAVSEIGSAATSDSTWLSLQSGIGAIQHGLDVDDADSSELGIAIVRDQCRDVDVYLQGAVSPSPSAPAPDRSTESPVPVGGGQ